jgi:outer membrane protein assembly factor BamB
MAFPAGWIHAFSLETGESIWRHELDGALLGSPAVAGGLVIVGTDNGKVAAFAPSNGAIEWQTELPGGIYAAPAIGDQLVYFTSKGADGRTVTALEMEHGTPRWSFAAGGEASPTLAHGMVLIADEAGGVVALDAASGGDPLWFFPTGGKIVTSPVVAGDTLYLSSGATLIAIDLADGSEVWRYATGFEIKTSPVVVNGRIYLGGAKGYLDALTGQLVEGSPAPNS